MIDVLRDQSFRRLFGAQVIALLGTGLLTVALALLAYDIAGGDAGVVLGTALAIKMVAYVVVAPVVSAAASNINRKTLLVGADAIRAGIALSLPMVSETWHIYVLVFALQAASATFTPAFQALIPEILPQESQYTRALSLSRLAYDMESLLSPVLAAFLLTVISYRGLFVGTSLGFVASAILVIMTALPVLSAAPTQRFRRKLLRGIRVFTSSHELKALLFINVVVAAVTSMILVNTVVLARDYLERPETDVAILLAAYGLGSMAVALVLPKILDQIKDRHVFIVGCFGATAALVAIGLMIEFAAPGSVWAMSLVLWFWAGAAVSSLLTPSARLLKRWSTSENRTDAFAAQFSVSHACFLVTYPLAGYLGVSIGLGKTALILGGMAAIATIAVPQIWRPAPVTKEMANIGT